MAINSNVGKYPKGRPTPEELFFGKDVHKKKHESHESKSAEKKEHVAGKMKVTKQDNHERGKRGHVGNNPIACPICQRM